MKHLLFLLAAAFCCAALHAEEMTGESSSPVYFRGEKRESERTRGRGGVMPPPRFVPGIPRADNTKTTDGYGSAEVRAELKINVPDSAKKVTFVQDNADPYVVTKAYRLKSADPYSLRGYLLSMVKARQVDSSPVQVTAVKYKNGTSVLLVSAEEYRFHDSESGEGIDRIVANLDKQELKYARDTNTYVYFPRYNPAANLLEMLKVVGSNELDPQFAVSPDKMMVDAELNALLINAPEWSYRHIAEMLKKYDVPMPEVRLTYRVMEIYAENDDRIGVDFQSWKNNEGVDLFSAGARIRRNWSSFYVGGVNNNGSNNTNYWNFNPKWNTRYLDFLTSIGKARILTSGQILAKNRESSSIEVNYGYFYDRNDFSQKVLAGTLDPSLGYTDPNTDIIPRQAVDKIVPFDKLTDSEEGYLPNAQISGISKRLLGLVESGLLYSDSKDALAKTLNEYYIKGNAQYSDGMPGIIHGKIQFPMTDEGFNFTLEVTPVVTSEAATIQFDGSTISLLGWNSDGSPRYSESSIGTRFQCGVRSNEFVIGGLKKSETVRSVAGLPFFKDVPILGLIFCTENESIKQSQLVVIAKMEYCTPENSGRTEEITNNIGKIVDDVNHGMDSKVGNMFFQQYKIDTDKIE